jgi:hypothetical protein
MTTPAMTTPAMTTPIPIERVLQSPRRGSSRPILAHTAEGPHLVKLRGAAQGVGALVAEVVAASLARRLGLPVLPHRLVTLSPTTPTDDHDDELADLLAASHGLNLATPMLCDARDASADDCLAHTSNADTSNAHTSNAHTSNAHTSNAATSNAHTSNAATCDLTPTQRAQTLWLDRLLLNPDRTRRNPNILLHDGRAYLIDFGAALRFQYDWSQVTEQTPLSVGTTREPHLFDHLTQSPDWPTIDLTCADLITRDALEAALALVPDSFLSPLLPADLRAAPTPLLLESLHRRRAAYVAFLWKRLKPPRPFAHEPPRVLHIPSSRPSWITRPH